MAISEQLIFIFDKYEQAGFREYILRKSRSKRDLELFDAVINNPEASPNELMVLLYGKPNRSAYKSTQTRLTEKLRDYLVYLGGGPLGFGEIYQDLAGAAQLLKRRAWQSALHFLNRAEEQAIHYRQYNILELIYSTELSEVANLGLDLVILTAKWKKNRERLDGMIRLNTVVAEVKLRHEEARARGSVLDSEAVLEEVRAEVRPTPEQANDPVYMERMVSLIRDLATSTKEYQAFERVVSGIYWRLKKKNHFQAGDADIEHSFLYMLGHAQFRNARFAEAMETLEQAKALRERMTVVPKTVTRKLIAIEASILNFTGRVVEAIPLLEKCLSQRGKFENDEELLNMQLSLAAYLYNARDYKRAVKVLNTFPYDKPTLTKLMGIEWRFKLDMFELISFYDRGMMDESETQLQRMRSFYKEFVQAEEYARVEVYLGFVKRMIDDPLAVTTEQFRRDVKAAQLNLSSRDEDMQAMAFYCWITSKIFQRDYYEVLLNAIGWKREEVAQLSEGQDSHLHEA
jgi:tetratricopeptide (TPR) repeat protein